MRLKDFLTEGRKKENKIVFVETDPNVAFPKDTITSLQKAINKSCKDLTKDWKNAVEVINAAFNELDVPIPKANQKARWEQYRQLIAYAVKNLMDSRGSKGNWTVSV